MIVAFAAVAALAVTAFLTFSGFARSQAWRATVTPLASIIGSGFLICGPLLAKEFGSAAILAEMVLLGIAYAAGAVIRFNIRHAEPVLAAIGSHDPIAWTARVGQVVLSVAYAISVAYYLKLLAEFGLKPLALDPEIKPLVARVAVTAIIAALAALAARGDLARVERVAHWSVSLKLGIIAGLLIALGTYWALRWDVPLILPPPRFAAASVPVLLGLVITVQGFETSRYLGATYPAEIRARTMRHAQWISTLIYAAFLALLTPFLAQAARTPGVAGILDIMELVAPAMGAFVLVGALSSQLSAAVADSLGAGGLMSEVSQGRLSGRVAFFAAMALSVAVVWLTDPYEVVALSSRAFALFYAFQCAIAFMVARRTSRPGGTMRGAFVLVGIVCLIAAAVGAPAEG